MSLFFCFGVLHLINNRIHTGFGSSRVFHKEVIANLRCSAALPKANGSGSVREMPPFYFGWMVTKVITPRQIFNFQENKRRCKAITISCTNAIGVSSSRQPRINGGDGIGPMDLILQLQGLICKNKADERKPFKDPTLRDTQTSSWTLFTYFENCELIERWKWKSDDAKWCENVERVWKDVSLKTSR